LILGYTPISSSFQAPKCVIRARDPRLHQISVAVPGFLLPQGAPIPEGTLITQPILEGTLTGLHIPEGVPKVALQPSSKEESEEEERQKKVVDVSDSEDFYEVFDQPLSPEMSTSDLDQSSQPLPSHFKEVATSEDEMGIQRKPRSTLQELLESQLGRDAPTKTLHTRLPTPPPTHPLRTDPVDLKRKRDNKGNEVMEGGKNLPPREPKNQKATK